jgi:hypothetical protein
MMGLALLGVMGQAAAAETNAVLNGSGTLWRSHIVWETPVVLEENGATRFLKNQQYFWMPAEDPDGKPVPELHSSPAADGWTAPDFDDHTWPQSDGPQGPGYRPKDWQHPGFSMWSPGSPAEVFAVCSRAKFNVAEPAAAGVLKLVLRYQGGAAVFLNGHEIARGHLPPPRGLAKEASGNPDAAMLATPYADDVYIDADGKAVHGEANAKSTPEQLAQYEKRIRQLEAEIPPRLLRKGVNVLAVEIRRAPYKAVYMGAPKEYRDKKFREWPWPWPHCRLMEARLTVTGDPGVVTANISRPAGLQVWQPHPWATVTGLNYGDPCEALVPIRLIGFRNGAFSAQLVVSATTAFSGLAVTTTELTGTAGGFIPSDHVRLRYPLPDGNRFDALVDQAPAETPLRDYRSSPNAPTHKVAMQPVWITVKVPADTPSGEYRGMVRILAKGLTPVETPILFKVHAWRLPDPQNLTMHNNLWQSQESVAARYRVPLWSDKHFDLMGQSLALTAPLANKFCNVHLVKGAFCIGNTEGMVRWVRGPRSGRPEGSPPEPRTLNPEPFSYDFSVFDRYLDLHEKILGKPRTLLIDVCVSIHGSMRPKDGTNPVKVSRLDPAIGKVVPMDQPPLTPATGVPFWKPVLEQVKTRLEKRGWWDVALLGTASDSGPTKDEALLFQEIWPDKAWLFSGHPNAKNVAGGVAPVACLEWVWGAGRLWHPAGSEGFLGGPAYPAPWKKKDVVSVAFPRLGAGACELFMRSPLSDYRLNPEKTMQSGMDGLGRVGINFWEFTDDKGRKRQLDFGRGTGQFFFNTAVPWLLGAGPDGPLPTTRSEMFREGLQVREAMTFLQQALENGKLAPELTARINELLRQRAMNILREFGDGQREWQANEDRLFALCAEAAGEAWL